MIKKEQIKSEYAPAAIGPYSQALKINNMIFVSGQLPIDVKTGELDGEDIISQTKRSFENIKAILEEVGLDLTHVIKTTVFMQNLNDFNDMNNVYSAYFTGMYPARSTIEVAKLPKNALVEIEVVAIGT